MKRTFAGIPEEYASYHKASVVVLPVAYDGTSTWIKGSDKGPEALLHAAENMELYDIETGTEVYRQGIYLFDELSGFSSPEQMTDAVYAVAKEQMQAGKLFSMIGGEHSVSIGALRAAIDIYGDITVLQLDAHADLRPEYNGSACNHACAVHEASKRAQLIQVGIRSMDISEVEHMKRENVFFAHEIINNQTWIDEVCAKLKTVVYITIDLDTFDPSILPSTGTTEPGGLMYYETLQLLKKVIGRSKVVGFDVVELCPNPLEKSSDFLAAKLFYKILSYIYQ